MIFLDYTKCGRDGEPSVVHVDQEDDYKITHLADSFEEFIRGLEPEWMYDDDDDYVIDNDGDIDNDGETDIDDDSDEDNNNDVNEDEKSHKGVFAGFVLMSKHSWDKAQADTRPFGKMGYCGT